MRWHGEERRRATWHTCRYLLCVRAPVRVAPSSQPAASSRLAASSQPAALSRLAALSQPAASSRLAKRAELTPSMVSVVSVDPVVSVVLVVRVVQWRLSAAAGVGGWLQTGDEIPIPTVCFSLASSLPSRCPQIGTSGFAKERFLGSCVWSVRKTASKQVSWWTLRQWSR